MELDDIRAFVAVAEARSVSGAARELFLTQPAVTRRVQRLELSMGATLIDRGQRPLALTSSGQAALEQCRQVLSVVRALRAGAALQKRPAGELRIGVAHALTEATLAEPVDRVRQLFPAVAFRLSTGWSRQLLERLRHGALDAAVVLLPAGEALPAEVTGRQIASEQLEVVGARAAKRAGLRQISDLRGTDWVLNPEGCGARAMLQRALRRAGIGVRVVVETYNYPLQLRLVARGRGLGLVPATLLSRSRFRSRLRVLRFSGLDFRLTIWALRGRGVHDLSVVMSALEQSLIESTLWAGAAASRGRRRVTLARGASAR